MGARKTRPAGFPRRRAAVGIRRWPSHAAAVLFAAAVVACGSPTDVENRGGPCPEGPLLSVPAIAVADLDHIIPLGNLNPGTTAGAHTLPTSHTYWNVTEPGTRLVTVYAPADLVILRINRSIFTNPSLLDYSIAFAVCDEVEGSFFHMSRLSQSLTSLLRNPHGCETSTVGSGTREECEFLIGTEVREGEILGSAVEFAFQRGLDFGLRDTRRRLTFARPDRLPPWYPNTVCPVDYYEPVVRAELEALFGKPGRPRTSPPLCGRIDFDVIGTVQGIWFIPGVSGVAAESGIALAADNVLPESRVFSIGGVGTSADGSTLYFTSVTNTGRVRRGFDQVTADGAVYCYDQLSRLPNQFAAAGVIALVQLRADGRLQFEIRTEADCGAGPWTFSAAAITLER